MDILAFKLITGEIIVAKSTGVIGNDGTIKLSKPQTLYAQSDKNGNQVVGFTDFAPFIKGDIVNISAVTVQCQGEADTQIAQGYIKMTTGLELSNSGGLIL